MPQDIIPVSRPVTIDDARTKVTAPSGAAAGRRHTIIGTTGKVLIHTTDQLVYVLWGDTAVTASTTANAWYTVVPSSASDVLDIGDAQAVSVYATADADTYIIEVS